VRSSSCPSTESSALIASARGIGIAVADWVKRRFPDCDVVVKLLPGGQVTVAAYKADDDPR
jgi:hypothetical protein